MVPRGWRRRGATGPRGRGLGWLQGSGWGSEQRGGPKACTRVEDSGGSGKWGEMTGGQPWWDLRGLTTPLLLLLSLLSLFPLAREELGNGGGRLGSGVVADGDRGADRQRSLSSLSRVSLGSRGWRAWPGSQGTCLRGARGGRQSAQNGRGPPEQPGLGAEYGPYLAVKGARDRTRTRVSVMLAPRGLLCRLTGPLRRDSLSPEGLSPGVPGPENNSSLPFGPSDSPRVVLSLCPLRGILGEAPPKSGNHALLRRTVGTRAQGSKRENSDIPSEDRPPVGPPSRAGIRPWTDSAPRTARTAPRLVQHRASLGQLPCRSPSVTALAVSPPPLPPAAALASPSGPRAWPGAWRVPLEGRARPRRAANRHPQFPQYNYQALVPENEAAGTAVLRVVAQDPTPERLGA